MKEAGCTTELDYTEQTSWMLFLKYLDDLEQEKAMSADLLGKPYAFIIDKLHRWSSWAASKNADGSQGREMAWHLQWLFFEGRDTGAEAITV
jgi:type I restriction enzyme M protein